MKYKLSKELTDVFNTARDMAVSLNCKCIMSEFVIYSLIKLYLNGGGEDKTVKSIVLELTPEKRLEFEKLLYLSAQNAAKSGQFTLDPKLFDKDNIPFSAGLEDVVERIVKMEELGPLVFRTLASGKKKKPEKSNEEVVLTTPALLGAFLYEDFWSIDLLKKYGFASFAMEYLKSTVADYLPGSTFPPSIPSDDEMKESADKKRDEIMDISKNTPTMSDEEAERADEEFEAVGANSKEAINAQKVDPNSTTPSLDRYAIDITKKARNGEYDPVVGRTKEIEEICEILCCRKKNNAILLGDPGTGKTAIVELLAEKIANGSVPKEIRERRIFSLDLNALVAGCIYRGQYEERLQNIIKEVVSNKDIIIFIDEIHNLLGNGSSSGQGDGANILKPYLARGEFQCIGSTTIDEYRKIIEKDGALKRRFQPVFIEEPNETETLSILKGLTAEYGKFHRCRYSDEVLQKCVEWSGKYISDRFFPDKAIGILDMASAVAKLNRPDDDSEIEKLEKEKTELENKINELVSTSNGDPDILEKAAKDMDRLNIVEKKIKAKNDEKIDDPRTWRQITVEDVCVVISKLSGVPLEKIMASDMKKIKEMKSALESKVVGQDEAINELTFALQRNILGLRDPNKPIASFLLVGNTGTGKTFVSKILAREFFGSDKALVTIACSEYMQDWAESKLLGSAPGYVGFSDSEPRLYVLKRRPYTVLLIDEIEKSSENLYNIWLNMLEEGEVTLSNGEKVNLRNAIIIFTGNVGTKALELKGKGIGFGKVSEEERKDINKEIVMEEIKKEFRPEFINRLSKIVVFNNLGETELLKIFDLELAKVKERYEEAGYALEVSDEMKKFVVDKCEPQYGARSLNRLIIENVDQPICEKMLETDSEGKKIMVSVEDTEVKVDFVE